jgi:peptide/nickel transport system permease protein
MAQYLIKRLSLSLFVILGVSMIASFSIHFLPADAVDLAVGITDSSPEVIAAKKHQLGLDRPPLEQYLDWMVQVLHGDLGKSLQTYENVNDMISQRLPVTLEFTILSTIIAVSIGVLSGIIAAVKQYSIADKIATIMSLIGVSMPSFWLATLLILIFSVNLKWLPVGGPLPKFSEDQIGNLKRMFMPALSRGLHSAAIYFRFTRSSMLEVVRQNYIVTARSKGLTEFRIFVVHALKNALIPVVTLSSMQIAAMLGGSFILETIFSLPGLGRTTLNAIMQRDFIVLQGMLLVYTSIVIIINLVLDIVYLWLDPRMEL